MKKNNKFYLSFFVSLFLAFLLSCFFPVLTHQEHPETAPGHVFLTDRNGEIITDKALKGGYKKEWQEGDGETLKNSDFVRALLRIEDKNFYSHWGVNIPAKIRALRDNLAGKAQSGGSTITEQYIKNTYFLGYPRNYFQKLREATLALGFSIVFSKEEILEKYLATVYFGNQVYGLPAAMEVYFDKKPDEALTQSEQVLLLTLLRNPGVTSFNDTGFQKYFSQTRERLGYEFEKVYTGKLPKKENIEKFPHFTQRWIQDNGVQGSSLENGNVASGEQSNRTTIDARLQTFAQETLQNTLSELKGKNVTNGAIFALNPRNGEVLLYLGSKDFYARDIDGQVDVIQAKRQMGSTMKPFLYLLALESGASPDDLLLDIESEYQSFEAGKVYVSENYSLQEYGLVRFKKALGNSLNNASVRLARELGLQRVYDYYLQFGLEFPQAPEHYGYALVLGNASITLESLVRAYTKLLDVSQPEKFLLYDILRDPDNRDISFGVNSILNTSIAQAVKTGTSSDFRDNLVISYHPDFVIGVWIGNNDNSSMQGVTGITGAGYVWHQIIEKAIELGYITEREILAPKGVISQSYCLDTACFRKENVYSRERDNYFSRLAENMFSEKDIFEILGTYEREKLGELGIELQ